MHCQITQCNMLRGVRGNATKHILCGRGMQCACVTPVVVFCSCWLWLPVWLAVMAAFHTIMQPEQGRGGLYVANHGTVLEYDHQCLLLVNCTDEQFDYQGGEEGCMTMWLNIGYRSGLLERVYDFMGQAAETLQMQDSVLCHCVQGRHRSVAAAIIIYYHHNTNLTWERAVEEVLEIVHPGIDQGSANNREIVRGLLKKNDVKELVMQCLVKPESGERYDPAGLWPLVSKNPGKKPPPTVVIPDEPETGGAASGSGGGVSGRAGAHAPPYRARPAKKQRTGQQQVPKGGPVPPKQPPRPPVPKGGPVPPLVPGPVPPEQPPPGQQPRAQWQCSQCYHMNPAGTMICTACANQRVFRGDWFCPWCKNLNREANSACHMPECRSHQESSAAESVLELPHAMIPVTQQQQWEELQAQADEFAANQAVAAAAAAAEAAAAAARAHPAGAHPSRGYPLAQTILPGDWICPRCNNHNFAAREKCNRCALWKPLAAYAE